MSKPIMLVFNDVHLTNNNGDIVKDCIAQGIDVAKDLGLDNIVCAGDFFDSRASQKLSTMKVFDEILDMIESAGIDLIIIHGNHDLSSYEDTYSWLSPYKHHPSIWLVDKPSFVDDNTFGGRTVAFIPFQIEEQLVKNIEKYDETDILISHFELNGSKSNGITAENRAINAGMLKKFKKVFLGHYHDTHEVTDNVIHMPSLFQRNFGENSVKGFTVINDDLSYEIIEADFKRYKTIKLNVDTHTNDDIKSILKEAKGGNINLRVEVSGSIEKIKAFKKDKLRQAGIDIKVKYSDLELPEDKEECEEINIGKLSTKDVKNKFDEFCDREELNKEIGEKYLKEVIKWD